MRTRRRMVMSLLIVAVLALSGVAVAAHSFTDVPDGHIFHDDIQWLADNNITKGCNPPANDEFCPEDPVTRGQMAAFLHRFAANVDGVAGPQGPQGEQGLQGEQGPQGEPGQALIVHATTPENPSYPHPDVGFLRVVDIPGGGVGADPEPGDVIVEVTIPDPGTYKVEGVVQFFEFGADDGDTSEYGYTNTYVGDEIVGSLWTADLPDDGSNGAMASGSQIIETTEANTVVKVVGVIRGDDDGDSTADVAGGNLIVTQFNE